MTSSTLLTNLPKLSGERNSDGRLILPIADGKQIIRILKLGKKPLGNMPSGNDVMWCDFEQVPQGYIIVCGTSLRKPKGARNTKSNIIHSDGRLIDPTDDQIIDYGKRMMVSTDIYDQSSGKNPDDFIWLVENKK